jgi:phosphoribosylformylglycinamidine synthase
LRNVICVGADPDRIAILDNFCWPGVDDAQAMGALVRACRGASDAAIAYGLPFISGKDSLNNQFSLAPEVAERLGLPQKIAIPGTLLISAIGIVNDVRRCVSMDLKSPGNRMVLLRGPNDSRRLDQSAVVHRSVAGLISQGRVRAAHDLSEGGLAVTLAEMCIASGLGLTVDLDRTLAGQLFAEPVAGYVLELTEGSLPEGSVPLGLVQQEPRLIVRRDGDTMINLAVKQLSDAWNSPLARCFGEGAHG